MLSKLPPEGEGWSQASRDNFVRAFGAVLDFCFPIEERASGKAAADE
jgi:hypothetical protein